MTPAERATEPDAIAGDRILVIGGAAGTGAWMAEKVWRRQPGSRVDVADIAIPPDGIDEGSAYSLVYEGDTVRGLPDLGRYDVIVVSVPIPQVERVARTVLPAVAPGTLVLDVASIKQQPMEIIEASLPAGVSFIGMHPLFRPAAPSLVGQTIVICPSRRSDQADQARLCALLRRHGAVVRVMSAAEHDHAMALVQVLTHFTVLTAASVLAERMPEFRRALDLLTPPFRALAGLVGRIVDIPEAPPNGPGARVYADIQTALYTDAQDVRAAFLRSAERLDGLARAGDADGLRQEVERVAARFPSPVVADCRQLFSQSSAAAQAEALELYRRHVNGQLSAFESTREGRVVVGRIEDFSPISVRILVQSARRRRPNGTFSYALGWDDASRKAAARLGFSFPLERREELPRGEYRLMSPAQFDVWKVEALEPHRRDVTISVREDADGRRLVGLLPRLVDGLLTSEPLSHYRPPTSSEVRWTARLLMRGDVHPDATVDELRGVLRDLAIVVQ